MAKPDNLTPAEVVEMLEPVLEDLDEILNRVFGTKLGYEIVSIQEKKTLSLYQALGNAHRYVRIVHDVMDKKGDHPHEPVGTGHVNGE